MNSRSLQVTAICLVIGAGALTWWMLGRTADEGGGRRRSVLREVGVRLVAGVEKAGFIEPDLPSEGGRISLTEEAAELRIKVAGTRVFGLRFDDTPLLDVIGELKRQSDINFLVHTDPDVKVSFHAEEASLREVMDMVAVAAGVQYDIQTNAVVWIAKDQVPPMTTRTYRMPDTGWPGIPGSAATTSGRMAEEWMMRMGIAMPEGAVTYFDPTSRRLIVRNTFEQLRRIDRLATVGPPGRPFVWKPVRAGDREYITARQVSDFYGFFGHLAAEGAVSFESESVEMSWRIGDRGIVIGGWRYFLSLPVIESEGTILVSRADVAWTLDPVLRPARAVGAGPLTTVVIDVLSNGRPRGAAARAEPDDSGSTAVAGRLKASLEESGWTVVMTNDEERGTSRVERKKTVQQHPGAVLVGIGITPGAGAVESHLSLPANAAVDPLRSQAVALAGAVHKRCHGVVGGGDGGISSARLDILEDVGIPAVVIRIGVGSSSEGGENVDRHGQIASAIAEGLEDYRRTAGRGRRAGTGR